jgi:SAM-dependent methyltransferase
MDRQVVREFWRKRAETGNTRWTGEGLLEFDRGLLGPLVGSHARILDLGSGFGELSRSICGPDCTLVAVEQEAAMGVVFADDPRFTFEIANVVDYEPRELFDVVLLFGVVTHLTEAEEDAVYDVIVTALIDGGVAVVKNQCSDGPEFEVSTFSENLGSAYEGRYPSVEHQGRRLANHFESVDVVSYPAEFTMHPDSSHVAFVCRGPRYPDESRETSPA